MKRTLPRLIVYERVLAGAFALAAALYVLGRIIVIPLFHDEASTYLVNARGSIWDSCTILNGNNHVLNSLLINLFTSLWGLQEWVIRLPNLLGMVLYLWGSFRAGPIVFSPTGFCPWSVNPDRAAVYAGAFLRRPGIRPGSGVFYGGDIFLFSAPDRR